MLKVSSYTTDAYTITACGEAGPALSSKIDCGLKAKAGDIFVVFLNNTITSTFTDPVEYSSVSSSIVNEVSTKSNGYALNATSIIFDDKVNGTPVPKTIPCCNNDVIDQLNVTITYSGPQAKYFSCPTIKINYLVPQTSGYITLESGRHFNDKNWKPFVEGSSCSSSRVTKGVITRTPIVLVLQTPDLTSTSAPASAASTARTMASKTDEPNSSTYTSTLSSALDTTKTAPSSSEMTAPSTSSLFSTSSPPSKSTDLAVSQITSEVLGTNDIQSSTDSTSVQPEATISSLSTTGSELASSSLSIQSSATSSASTSSVASTASTNATSSGVTESGTSALLVPSKSTAATFVNSFSSQFARNSTSTNITTSGTLTLQSQNTTAPTPASFFSFSADGDSEDPPDGDQEISPESNQPSSDPMDLLPPSERWWNSLVETAVYTWIGPQMYLPPKFYNGKWYDFTGNVIQVPDDWIIWGEKILWPPPNWDGVSIPSGLGSPGGSSTAVSSQVKTEVGRTTIHTIENGQPTDVVSAFTSLITKPPVVPSISTSVGTSTFVTTVNGKPTTTSIRFTSAWAIGPSETVTSVGTSLVQTVIDGTTTSVPKLFTTTKITPGQTFALFGRVTTVSTVVNGTTSRVTVSVVVGTSVAATGLPATNEASFTEIIENGDGITYVVTNGMTKTLAVSGSIVDSSAFPTRTGESVTVASANSRLTLETFVTEVASQTGLQTGSSQMYIVVATGDGNPTSINGVGGAPTSSAGMTTTSSGSSGKTSNASAPTAYRASLFSVSFFFGVIGVFLM
ncbi:hypothetical protein TWF694_006690 [Orbilia ellipsospora]|uniref:Uncharacterized protein n=1 Tax=Orbilia ellipsospora TaxID=2528407 RepID=A0AAV9XL99_9PEZI